jgi:hypothetical protein
VKECSGVKGFSRVSESKQESEQESEQNEEEKILGEETKKISQEMVL